MEFGVESGSESVLKAMNKDISLESLKKAFSNTRKLGIKTQASFMAEYPGETYDDVIATKKFLKEINPSYCYILAATPYPGTAFNRLAKEKGILKKDIPYDMWSSIDSVLEETEDHTLKEAQRNLYEENFFTKFTIPSSKMAIATKFPDIFFVDSGLLNPLRLFRNLIHDGTFGITKYL